MLKYKIMFQIFFVPKYFWVLEAVIFGTLLPEHPVDGILKKPDEVATSCSSLVRAFVSRLDFSASNGGHQTWN